LTKLSKAQEELKLFGADGLSGSWCYFLPKDSWNDFGNHPSSRG